MIVAVDKPKAGLAQEARSVLLAHTPGDNGMRRGCYEFACALSRFPCPQARWARAVRGGEPS